jgi:ABC-type sugar transport system substrate-binding protein
MPYTGEFWWNTIVEYVGRAAKLDGWNFNFTTADGSDTTQFDQITTYAQKADVLFVFPTSFTGINEAVRIAEQQYHCPVVSFKGYITGASRFCEMFDDFKSGELMAKEAVAWIQKKFGTTKGKTVVAVNGDLKQSGWKLRQDGFDWIKENHPEINYIAIQGGLSPEGWADVADSCLAGAGSNADAIISASDGPYLLGTISALAKYGKLYYVGDPRHVFVASIDGKPSTLQWLRMGYVDTVYSQVPDAISYSAWEVAKKYILKDSSYQSPPYTMPEIPVPLTVRQPAGSYWGGKDSVMKIEAVEYSETPTGTTPAPRVDRTNVNTWELYGNSIIRFLGQDIRPTPTFAARGTQPAWSAKLLSDYKAWAAKQ